VLRGHSLTLLLLVLCIVRREDRFVNSDFVSPNCLFHITQPRIRAKSSETDRSAFRSS
jgi:hypothetical protein